MSPEANATFVSKMFFAWFDGLIWKGWKNPLKADDLYELNPDDHSSHILPKWIRWEVGIEGQIWLGSPKSILMAHFLADPCLDVSTHTTWRASRATRTHTAHIQEPLNENILWNPADQCTRLNSDPTKDHCKIDFLHWSMVLLNWCLKRPYWILLIRY